MVEAVIGAAIGLAVTLGYLLLVEVMAAAILLLCQFVVLQVRALCALLVEPPRSPVPVEARDQARGEPSRQPYLLGGSLRHWE